MIEPETVPNPLEDDNADDGVDADPIYVTVNGVPLGDEPAPTPSGEDPNPTEVKDVFTIDTYLARGSYYREPRDDAEDGAGTDCGCTDCYMSDEEIYARQENESNGITPKIDSRGFPHIIDLIRDYATEVAPLAARGVCQSWRKTVDQAYIDWLSLSLSLPGVRRIPGTGVMEAYSWRYEGVRLPIPYRLYSLSSARPATVKSRAGVDFRKVRTLDIWPCVLFTRQRMTLKGFMLDTVRFQQNCHESASFNAAFLLGDVRRIIFKDGPYSFSNAAVAIFPNEHAAHGDRPERYTKRIVANCRTPVRHCRGHGLNIPPFLEELVLIFHGWRVVSWFNEGNHDEEHPLSDAASVALEAARAGARVTVVNADLFDLKTGRRHANVYHVREKLYGLWRDDLEQEEAETGVPPDEEAIVGGIEWLTLDQYKYRVGEEEFRIETMTDEHSYREVV